MERKAVVWLLVVSCWFLVGLVLAADGGLVSVTPGATPFYTNSSNPATTGVLGEGDSEVVTFFVNATGDVGVYEFYGYANLTSNASISAESERFNVTILHNNNPSDPVVALVSTDGLNRTFSDLNCSGVVTDMDGDDMNVSVWWYRDSVLHSIFDYDNNYANGTLFWAMLDSSNTSVGEDWTCEVRAWDGWGESEPTIRFVWPTPENGSGVSGDSIFVNYYVKDDDLDEKYSFIDMDNSLVGWWRFDNDSAVGENDTRVYDWSGNGNNGTVVEANWNSSGRFGGSYEFDGDSSAGIVIADDSSLQNMPSYTISAWLRLNQY